ncbi:MAG: hypothetical protein C0404_08405 [Verrucomicrobia bacterium]|nr:hypothetical protein [Verrucomicrobiota bacterium]
MERHVRVYGGRVLVCVVLLTGCVIDAEAAPTANNQSASAAQGDLRRALPGLSANSSGTGYKYTILSLPGHGTLEYRDAAGVWHAYAAGTPVTQENKGWQCYFTPTTGYAGTDSFTWKIADPAGAGSGIATYSLTVAANTAPVANNSSISTVQDPPYRVTASLSYTDPDSGQPFSFTLLSGPAHGKLEWYNQDTALYNNVVIGTPVCSPLKPYDASGWRYTPAAGYSGPDSFTWKMGDGIAQSGVATVSIAVIANNPPVACDQKAVVIRNDTNSFRAFFTDADSGQTWTASIVGQPAHGTVTASGYSFTYVSSGTYTGTDSFTWKVSDGIASSGTATCRLFVRNVADRSGLVVLIVVKDTLLPEISTEVNRLKADIQHDGYTAKIVTFNGTTAKGLWDLLKAEYDTAGQFMSGAILIGNLPFYVYPGGAAGEKQDWIFWNMQKYSVVMADQTDARHIWVSRFFARDQSGGEMMAGSEPALIKRALQANHDYRTGASRLPLTAWRYDAIGSYETTAPQYLDLFPEAKVPASVLDAYRRGGALLDEDSHGNTGATYYDGNVTEYTLHDGGVQLRFALCSSCYVGRFGGVVNNQIYTRGGGNIFSVAGTCVEVQNTFSLVGKMIPNPTPFRARLAAGETWGDTIATRWRDAANNLSDYSHSAAFHGDLSVKAKVAPANQMPVISSISVDKASGVAPLTATITAAASDPDGTIAKYEWFLRGFDYGRNEPDYAGTSGSLTHTYTLAHRYPVRVHVVDNYKAWAYATKDVAVAPDPAQPIRVNCGRNLTYFTPSADYTDAAGDVWMHDQYFASGTWGFDAGNEGYVNAAVANTADDAIYQRFRSAASFAYRVPVANGTYWLNLYFADMQSSAAGQRVMDVDAEGVAMLTGLDVFGQMGGKAAAVVPLCVSVADGELTFTVRKNSSCANDVFLNCFEILPYSGGNRPPVAQSKSVSTSRNIAVPVTLVATDADGDSMTYSVVSQPQHGTLSGIAPNLTYTPVNNYVGADSFGFRANDGKSDGNVAVVSIAVCGLAAQWKLDETGGVVVSDATGNGHSGTLSNGVAWTSGGKFDGAAQFAAANDAIMLSQVLPLAADWTISAWFTAPLPATASWHTLMRGSGSSGDHLVILDSNLNLGMYDNLTAGQFRSSGYNMGGLSTGWHHLAAVGSGATTKFYVDGALVGTSDRKGGTDVYCVGNYQGGGQRFADRLDDVRVYVGALTAQEIVALANGTAAVNPDINANGIPDNWEIQNFGSTNAVNGRPQDDWDGDGMCNLAEYVSGTSPTNPVSRLQCSVFGVQGGGCGLSFGTVTGRLYSVKCIDDLLATNWVVLTNNVPGTGGQVQISDPSRPGRRFYRVGVKMP